MAASAALPIVYKPVEIKGRQLIDGGIRRHQRGHRGAARRQVRDRRQSPRAVRERLPEGHPHHARQPRPPGGRHGLPADRLPDVQAAGSPAPARGGRALAGEVPGRRHHPDRARPQRRADVRDEHHELHEARGHRPARLESVTLKLAEDYENLKSVCAKHGIEISATRVRKVVRKFEEEREKTAAWRRILEQTTGALLRQSGGLTRARRG